MTRISLKPFLWLTVLVGYTGGLLIPTPQPAIAQTHSPVLMAQRSDELKEAKRLHQRVIQLRQQGKYNEAIPIAKRVLEIRERLLGANHPDVAQSLNSLALLYHYQGRYEEAEPLYHRSLAIWEKALGENHPLVATSLSNLALFYYSQGDTTQAINFLSRGLDVEEQNLNVLLATGSERHKQDSMKTISNTTDIAVSLHIKNAPNNSEAARLALTTLLRRKGRILDVLTNDLQLLRENITPENQEFLDQLQTVRTQLATLIYNKPENLSQEQYRQQVTSLRKEADNL